MSKRALTSTNSPTTANQPASNAAKSTTVLPPIVDVRYGSPRSADRTSTSERIPSLIHTAAPSSASSPASSYAESDLKFPRPFQMHQILNPPTNSEVKTHWPADASRASSTGASRFSAEASPVSSAGRITPGRGLPPGASFSAQYPINGRPSSSQPSSRVPSLSSINLPNATIDAKKSPFLADPSQNYQHEQAMHHRADAAAAASPSTNARPSYGFPQHGSLPDRPASGSANPTAPSQADSPSTSYSSFSHMSRRSPAPQTYTIPPPTSAAYHAPSPGAMVGPHITLGTDPSYGNAAPTTGPGTSYQLMTLDTGQGPIQVPVDVQAASKMADEKRKRNAGASARFRQRRKEKEREANTTIAKLEAQIRAANEHCEFYRSERDYFRSLVHGTPAQAHIAPRMPSPRQRQASVISATSNGSPIGGSPSIDWQRQSDERGGHDGRNTRRRIDSSAASYDSASTSQTASPGFGPPQYLPRQEPVANLPPMHNPHLQAVTRAQQIAAGTPPQRPLGNERAWNPHA